jgi:hypothetical protein
MRTGSASPSGGTVDRMWVARWRAANAGRLVIKRYMNVKLMNLGVWILCSVQLKM